MADDPIDPASPVESVLELPDAIPVEDAPEEERPRRKLTEKLRDVDFDKAALARDIVTDHENAIQDRSDWETRLAEGYDRYLNVTEDKNFPWEGAANFHPPVTMTVVETLKPRLIEAIIGQDPKVLVLPVGAEDDEKAQTVERFLNWQIEAEIPLQRKVDTSAHLFLTAGIVWAKVRWKRRFQPVKQVRSFPPDTSMEIIFQTLFGQAVPEDLEKTGGDFRWEGRLRYPGGRTEPVTAEFAFFDDEIQVLYEGRDLVSDAPAIEFPDPEDIIVPARAGDDLQDYPFIQQRLWMNEYELRGRARSGQFDVDIVEEVIRRGPTGMDHVQDTDAARQRLEQQEGVDPQASDARADQWEVIEDYRADDLDGDGMAEEIVCWVAARSKLLLGWDYLHNVNASGKRPFEREVFMPLPNRTYGISMPEMIRDIQDEMTVMHNQRVDYGTLANLPFYVYRATGSTKPNLHRLKPGEGLPADNPAQDIVFPQLRTNTSFGYQEEALLQQYLERLTGVTDMALGRQPNRVGATRTATGVASLLSESGLRFKVFMSRFQDFWVRIFGHVLALDQQYLPPGKEFRVTGRPEVIRVKDRTEIAGKFDLRLAATTETLNKQSMRETAQIKLTTMLNPIMLQAGTVGLRGIYELGRDFLVAYGETNPLRILETPQVMPPKQPVEEHAIFISGGDVEPSPAENVQQHMQEHQFFENSPESLYMTPEARQKFRAHINKTAQMMLMQQIVQQMGGAKGGKSGAMGPGGQQGMNAQTGRAQPQLGPGPAQPQGASPNGAPMAQGMGVGPFA